LLCSNLPTPPLIGHIAHGLGRFVAYPRHEITVKPEALSALFNA
jgi:hypothetical protein